MQAKSKMSRKVFCDFPEQSSQPAANVLVQTVSKKLDDQGS